jgi:osmoprotectant transport system ATP-binding protein
VLSLILVMIEIDGISKRFGKIVALSDIQLTIQKAQNTVLIGPSGCGKSTLLRLLIGLLQPDRGSISIDETAVTEQTVLKLRKRIGYVIQEGGLFPHLNARQNVTLMARYLRQDNEQIHKKLVELAELARFPVDRLSFYPLELSGGQRQRLSLMRALMLDPDVLLFDEPLAALDPMIRSELQSDLKTIFQKLNKTVVWVTHDIGEAGFFGDCLVLFRDGRIVQSGILNELIHSPADPFVTQFINAQRSPLEFISPEPS